MIVFRLFVLAVARQVCKEGCQPNQ